MTQPTKTAGTFEALPDFASYFQAFRFYLSYLPRSRDDMERPALKGEEWISIPRRFDLSV